MFRPTAVIASLAVVIATTPAFGQTIRYVDDSADPGGGGLTWATAYDDLQDALDDALANPSVDELHVAGGTYRPSAQSEPGTPRTETFQLIDGLAIMGGHAGLDNPNTPDIRDLDRYGSTLSGDIGTSGDPSDNCYSVVTGSNSACQFPAC